MSRPDRDRRPSSTGGTFATNPAERYLDARQDLAEYRREARRGPLFAHAFEARITDAERRMTNALGRMEREGGSYDLWGTGVAIVAVPDDHFAYRHLEAR